MPWFSSSSPAPASTDVAASSTEAAIPPTLPSTTGTTNNNNNSSSSSSQFNNFENDSSYMPLRSTTSTYTPSSSAGRPSFMQDKNIAALAAAAGSDDSILRGRYLAFGMITIGIIGAVGMGLRPVYRHAFAARAAQETALRSLQQAQRKEMNSGKVETLIERLNVLQARHRSRHPLLYNEDGVSKEAR